MHDATHKSQTLWLATALHAFTHIYQVALIPLYLLIQRDLHLTSDAQATFLVTALSIAYFLPSYPMGMLADRVSRKKLLAVGLLVNALGFVALAFAPSYGVAVACVIVAGLGGSFYHPAATALIARLYPNETGKALGKVALGASFGFFIAPLYAGWRSKISTFNGVELPHFLAGWRGAVFELGVAGVIGTVLFFILAKDSPAPTIKTKSTAPKEKIFATPLLWTFFLAASFVFCLRDFAGSGMASLGSLFLQHAHGYDAMQTGLALSCIYLASMISNPLFGHLSDRGRSGWAAMLLIGAAITIYVFPHAQPRWFPVLLAAYGFFFMATYPIVEASLMESVHDSVRGRVFGCFITIGGLLGNLSHWFVGKWVKNLETTAHDSQSYFGIYNLLALFVLLSLFGLYFLNGIRKQEHIAPSVKAEVHPLNPEV
ncbi:MAG: Major facilitator superfamily 1 [Verrucomicrobiales bacterium]|nr:Major facilitator superfamily 1 [Verrucomicrobiales bacterium]